MQVVPLLVIFVVGVGDEYSKAIPHTDRSPLSIVDVGILDVPGRGVEQRLQPQELAQTPQKSQSEVATD